ncbi:hypothetical protein BKH41_04045 [Helicobacter sp. 12S02232-10]|uniref:outer membrane beta-barrel protein n=1 Tax=Helicobacter sp. 12S02232-10 TaxID=1476197 RepID=UPI000BA5AC1B|nr:outer membrane beta-barrel protein [Helicobacter sp. 12S02232-10]PAF49259.1 hypothetical protein BKH41_04045 [Helicobacter sp. 12S02232-10]
MLITLQKALATAGMILAMTNSAFADNRSDKSGIFIGAELGGSIGYSLAKNKDPDSMESETKILTNLQYGARIGYQQYFNAYNGLRLYGTFNYTNFTYPLNDSASTDLFKYGANIDYLLNFSDSESPWGLFIGGGYQWVQSKDFSNMKKNASEYEKVASNGFVINAGFSKIIDNHSRLELGVKVPLYNYYTYDFSDASESTKIRLRNPVDIYVAYSYSF